MSAFFYQEMYLVDDFGRFLSGAWLLYCRTKQKSEEGMQSYHIRTESRSLGTRHGNLENNRRKLANKT